MVFIIMCDLTPNLYFLTLSLCTGLFISLFLFIYFLRSVILSKQKYIKGLESSRPRLSCDVSVFTLALSKDSKDAT